VRTVEECLVYTRPAFSGEDSTAAHFGDLAGTDTVFLFKGHVQFRMAVVHDPRQASQAAYPRPREDYLALQ
jgi:hypothetical protein